MIGLKLECKNGHSWILVLPWWSFEWGGVKCDQCGGKPKTAQLTAVTEEMRSEWRQGIRAITEER